MKREKVYQNSDTWNLITPQNVSLTSNIVPVMEMLHTQCFLSVLYCYILFERMKKMIVDTHSAIVDPWLRPPGWQLTREYLDSPLKIAWEVLPTTRQGNNARRASLLRFKYPRVTAVAKISFLIDSMTPTASARVYDIFWILSDVAHPYLNSGAWEHWIP